MLQDVDAYIFVTSVAEIIVAMVTWLSSASFRDGFLTRANSMKDCCSSEIDYAVTER